MLQVKQEVSRSVTSVLNFEGNSFNSFIFVPSLKFLYAFNFAKYSFKFLYFYGKTFFNVC